jgi:hypothetical protein
MYINFLFVDISILEFLFGLSSIKLDFRILVLFYLTEIFKYSRKPIDIKLFQQIGRLYRDSYADHIEPTYPIVTRLQR